MRILLDHAKRGWNEAWDLRDTVLNRGDYYVHSADLKVLYAGKS
jgi:hypothetical protein